jgi:glycosyltransferase involved in cell wall biosynthesis
MPHPFGYAETRSALVPRIWYWLGGRIRAGKNLPEKAFFWMLWKLWAWAVLIWALRRFDAFIFIFGTSITNSAFEDHLHRWRGNRIVFVNCGSDIRPQYIDGPAVFGGGPVKTGRLRRIGRRMTRRHHRRERLGFTFVNSPTTAQFYTRPYVNWFAVGVPRDVASEGAGTAARSTPVRILHSPSHPEIKGSDAIRAMIERLRAKGHSIDFIELRGVPNARVMEELAACDFVIDQLYSDTPMAGFAMEAAMFGKPAVVGSYAADLLATHREAWSLPPSVCVHPDAVEAAIERLLLDPVERNRVGRAAQDFVRTQWSLDAVAARYQRLLEGDVPDAWIVQPDFSYVHGCGLPEARARHVVRQMIDAGGVASLDLAHAPATEAAFAAFAEGRPLPGRDA